MPNQQGESTEHTASKFSFMFTWSSFPVLLQEIGSTARVCLVYMLSQWSIQNDSQKFYYELYVRYNNNNNDRLTAFDPGQPG